MNIHFIHSNLHKGDWSSYYYGMWDWNMYLNAYKNLKPTLHTNMWLDICHIITTKWVNQLIIYIKTTSISAIGSIHVQ